MTVTAQTGTVQAPAIDTVTDGALVLIVGAGDSTDTQLPVRWPDYGNRRR